MFSRQSSDNNKNEVKTQHQQLPPNNKIYTISFETKAIKMDSNEITNNFTIFYTLSHIFKHFVRRKGRHEYKIDDIIFPDETEIELERSLPLLIFEKKIYIFSNMDELRNFYNERNLHIDSIKFNTEELIDKDLSVDELSSMAEKLLLFDCYLQVETTKLQ